ncbi:MAG: hypothetical protein A2W99_05015 [Bacteroidetes bacterium GWF2_33_16]|nr:MAG: hypothetical protein A2X00_17535 [Bacteroidetes bacterium GWE2_32_14]OFY06027.1 MAG: hypothetical protein A2W99_05015 [Bacteroidetes bacterium GWF2_33_16]
MKKSIILVIIVIITIIFACQPKQVEITKAKTLAEQVIDSSLINTLEADEFGMKKYVIAFLKRGPNRPTDSVEAAKLQKAHLENIMRLADEGKLIIAGPFMDDIDDVRGIYIFDVETIEEAKKLTETDPAIQAGSLVMELKPWYGSAALLLVPEIHKKLEKKNIAE